MMEKETNCELHKTDEVHVMEHERGKSSNVAVENMLKSQLQQLKEQSVEVEKKSAARLQELKRMCFDYEEKKLNPNEDEMIAIKAHSTEHKSVDHDQKEKYIAKLEDAVTELSRDKNELLNELEQHRIDAKENQLKMDLKATELEKKWKMEIKLKKQCESRSETLSSELEKEKHFKDQVESTIQHQLEKERQISIQLQKEKICLEKKLKERAIKFQVNDLVRVLVAIADLQPQWEELGLALGLSHDELKLIACSHNSVCRCFYEMLRFWIVRVGGSWDELIIALKSPQVKREDVAQQITDKHIKDNMISCCFKSYIVVKGNEKPVSSKDGDLIDVLKSVDWKVLGLLLGLSDNTLERIQDESHTLEGCRESMILHWTKTGHSHWSVLVDVLKGPVLGELKLANDLTKTHLDIHSQDIVKDEVMVDDIEIQSIQSEIFHVLNSTTQDLNSQARGIIFIFGISGAAGTDVDVNNVYSTFKDQLKFAAFRRENLSCSHMATHIKAAATFDYPMFCKHKAFYFAGHGGIDKNQQPFFNAVSEKPSEVISVQKNILTFFQSTQYKPSESFLFFFDCCLSSNESKKRDRKPFAFEIPVRCLVAFATSPGLASCGSQQDGGQWTKLFCQNLRNVKKAETLTAVLDCTHQAVMKQSNRAQPPQYSSCVGPIYLKGPPESENDKSCKEFTTCHDELIELLSSDDDTCVSLASILCLENIIDKEMKTKIRQCKGKQGAIMLVCSLEQSIRRQCEVLPKVLNIMDEEESLHHLVMRIKRGTQVTEEKTITDLYKALDQSVQRVKELEYQVESMKKALHDIEEERTEKEEETKKERIDAINKVQVFCSLLQKQLTDD